MKSLRLKATILIGVTFVSLVTSFIHSFIPAISIASTCGEASLPFRSRRAVRVRDHPSLSNP